jgi:hypothetical protein
MNGLPVSVHRVRFTVSVHERDDDDFLGILRGLLGHWKPVSPWIHVDIRNSFLNNYVSVVVHPTYITHTQCYHEVPESVKRFRFVQINYTDILYYLQTLYRSVSYVCVDCT